MISCPLSLVRPRAKTCRCPNLWSVTSVSCSWIRTGLLSIVPLLPVKSSSQGGMVDSGRWKGAKERMEGKVKMKRKGKKKI